MASTGVEASRASFRRIYQWRRPISLILYGCSVDDDAVLIHQHLNIKGHADCQTADHFVVGIDSIATVIGTVSTVLPCGLTRGMRVVTMPMTLSSSSDVLE